MNREGVLSLTNFRTKSTTIASIWRKVFSLKMIFSLIVVPTDFPTQSTRDCSINVLGQVEDCQILETVSAFREDNLRRERVNRGLWKLSAFREDNQRRERVNRGSPCSCNVGFDQLHDVFSENLLNEHGFLWWFYLIPLWFWDIWHARAFLVLQILGHNWQL